jgi:hypothetical protein
MRWNLGLCRWRGLWSRLETIGIRFFWGLDVESWEVQLFNI